MLSEVIGKLAGLKIENTISEGFLHASEDHNHHPSKSDLVMTPLLEEYGLVYNKHWNLIICRNCKEGLPLRSVPEHLMAVELSRWDSSIGKKAITSTKHIPVPPMRGGSAAAKGFINQLVQSLIDGGYIGSKDDILDAASTPEWVKKFQSLPNKPVEGIAIFDGWIDSSSHAQRSRRGLSSINKPGPKKKPIIKRCFIQTFTETFPNFFPVHPTQEEEEKAPKQVALQPMDLLLLEKSRLLSGNSSLINSATDRRALLPIFVDSGIEGWLDQFDRSTIFSQFPQCPAAGQNSTPKSYTRLAKANLILFGEDMKTLSDIHHSVRYAITNATP